jgi:GT2 family glycosyltransferase
MDGALMTISVIISTYRRLEEAVRAASSVHPQLEPGDELIVVDNGFSPDLSSELETQLAPLGTIFLRELRPGMSHARNAGAARAHGDVLAFLDDDAIAHPNWLKEIRRAFADPAVGCAGGPALLPEKIERPAWYPNRTRFVFGEVPLHKSPQDIKGRFYPAGCNLAVRARSFEQVGGFPTSYGRKGESLESGEDEYLARAVRRTAGRLVYLPGAVVTHDIGSTRLTWNYLRCSAYQMGRACRRLVLEFDGVVWCILEAMARLLRIAIVTPKAVLQRFRGDLPAWTDLIVRWYHTLGFLGLPSSAARAPLQAPLAETVDEK